MDAAVVAEVSVAVDLGVEPLETALRPHPRLSNTGQEITVLVTNAMYRRFVGDSAVENSGTFLRS